MGPVTSVSVYLLFWWMVFLTILPIGSTSFHEAGIEPTPGGDPGAPVNPNMKKKVITTTWVSAIVFIIFWLVVHFGLLNMPGIAKTY